MILPDRYRAPEVIRPAVHQGIVRAPRVLHVEHAHDVCAGLADQVAP